MEQFDIVSQLVTVAPVVAVLLWVVIYFRGELKEKNEEIRELNAELRASEKEAISMTKDLNNTLQLLIAQIKNA